ncbi:unnamed protein product [Trypanosoma congolense IL3000]|uniref:WGS project CAEQ00000000 data, annotated contig 33 n=1 Tax=Trypanosoma congolense (strain IL3000) TaxID=1068625 RepID=F9WF00_TRYCI|nr:unnamed protein product [Trypanosoma congolense IL3000]
MLRLMLQKQRKKKKSGGLPSKRRSRRNVFRFFLLFFAFGFAVVAHNKKKNPGAFPTWMCRVTLMGQFKLFTCWAIFGPTRICNFHIDYLSSRVQNVLQMKVAPFCFSHFLWIISLIVIIILFRSPSPPTRTQTHPRHVTVLRPVGLRCDRVEDKVRPNKHENTGDARGREISK